MLQDWIDNHETYVLIGRDQYQVFLDNKDEPTEMWSPILFSVGDIVLTDGAKPGYRITVCKKVSPAFELRKYGLVKT